MFVDNLYMQPAANLDEFKRRATKFMQLEELREFHNQARVEASREKKKGGERAPRLINFWLRR